MSPELWKVERIGADDAPVESFAISKWELIKTNVRYKWVLQHSTFTLEQAQAWTATHMGEHDRCTWLV